MSEENKDFMHIGGNQGFQSRAKSIFESLDSLEPPKQDEEVPTREIIRAKRRRPNLVPDHVLHPQKWTKYSLEEDGSESLGRMSANEANKHAALSFLNELKDRRKSGDNTSISVDDVSDVHTGESSSERHPFAKPCEKDTKSNTADNKAQIQQKEGVTVMPEYVVGKTKPPSKPQRLEIHPSSSRQQVKVKSDVQISHLLSAEEESDLTDVKGDSNQEKFSLDKDKEKPNKAQFSKRKHSKNIRKHISNDDDDNDDDDE